MDQLIERCAGLDVHKATVTACVRVPGRDWDAAGTHVPDDVWRTPRTTGLVGRASGHPRGDGEHRRLLEADLLHARRSLYVSAGHEKTADRYAGYLVYFAIACAAMTRTSHVRSTISVIIVAGACGIAAGTLLAILGAIGRAARTGAIIKGGRYLRNPVER